MLSFGHTIIDILESHMTVQLTHVWLGIPMQIMRHAWIQGVQHLAACSHFVVVQYPGRHTCNVLWPPAQLNRSTWRSVMLPMNVSGFVNCLHSCSKRTGLDSLEPTVIWEDNVACKHWCENPINHAKQKHIAVAYHYVREQQTEFKTLYVDKIAGTDNIADTGTKPLPLPAFEKHLRSMMNLGDHSLRRQTDPTPSKAQDEKLDIPADSGDQPPLTATTEATAPEPEVVHKANSVLRSSQNIRMKRIARQTGRKIAHFGIGLSGGNSPMSGGVNFGPIYSALADLA